MSENDQLMIPWQINFYLILDNMWIYVHAFFSHICPTIRYPVRIIKHTYIYRIHFICKYFMLIYYYLIKYLNPVSVLQGIYKTNRKIYWRTKIISVLRIQGGSWLLRLAPAKKATSKWIRVRKTKESHANKKLTNNKTWCYNNKSKQRCTEQAKKHNCWNRKNKTVTRGACTALTTALLKNIAANVRFTCQNVSHLKESKRERYIRWASGHISIRERFNTLSALVVLLPVSHHCSSTLSVSHIFDCAWAATTLANICR